MRGREAIRERYEELLTRPVVGPFLQVVTSLGRHWREDRVTGLAAEVAFWALLSIVPMMLVLAALLGFLEELIGADLAQRAEDSVVEGMNELLTSDAEPVSNSVEQLFQQPSPGLLSIALPTLLWTASRVFAAIANALDVVYDLEERRSWVKRRVVGLALSLGSLIVVTLVLSMLLVGPLLGGGESIADEVGMGDQFVTLWEWFRIPVVVVIMLGWATTVLHLAPNHVTPWRWDLPGALLAAGSWGLFTFGFRVYLEYQGDNVVVSGLGGVLIAVLWLFLIALGLLLGGELNAVLGRRNEEQERYHSSVQQEETR